MYAVPQTAIKLMNASCATVRFVASQMTSATRVIDYCMQSMPSQQRKKNTYALMADSGSCVDKNNASGCLNKTTNP